jgi:phage-related protein
MPYSVEYFDRHVLEAIERWPVGALAAYARLVEMLMDFGPSLGMPHSRPLGDGLFELRPGARDGACRALYCFMAGERVVVVHAFVKRIQRTPGADLRMARRRVRQVRGG